MTIRAAPGSPCAWMSMEWTIKPPARLSNEGSNQKLNVMSWYPMVSCNHCWLFLAIAGYYRVLLMIVGYCRLWLDIVDDCWFLLVVSCW